MDAEQVVEYIVNNGLKFGVWEQKVYTFKIAKPIVVLRNSVNKINYVFDCTGMTHLMDDEILDTYCNGRYIREEREQHK